jgi:hypothetical protein
MLTLRHGPFIFMLDWTSSYLSLSYEDGTVLDMVNAMEYFEGVLRRSCFN